MPRNRMATDTAMDLIELLEARNLGLISRQVFRHLSLSDLQSCVHVSKLWKSVIEENFSNIVRESSRETESKWLRGNLRVTKLDHVDYDKKYLIDMTIICRHGYNFFFPPKSTTDDEQLMVVYYGSKFINKVAVPNCGLTKDLDDDSDVDSWDWNYLDVLDNGSGNFILVARSAHTLTREQEYIWSVSGRYNP